MSRVELHAKLVRMGFPFEPEEVVSAVVAAARYVARQQPRARVHVQGSPGLRAELRMAGLRLVGADRAEFLVVGHDPGLTYRKLMTSTRALLAGARFIAINRDGLIASPSGFFPGAGMAVGALEAAIGRGPEVVVGKPGPLILEEAARLVGCDPAECCFVGDNLGSDIGAAQAAGMASLFVLSGLDSEADLARFSFRPTYQLDSVAALPEAMIG
jgi:HAD superfamily hydrolase (TIGR01450 family)